MLKYSTLTLKKGVVPVFLKKYLRCVRCAKKSPLRILVVPIEKWAELTRAELE
jgi:hypothetical protein